jgi:hypothetical protein
MGRRGTSLIMKNFPVTFTLMGWRSWQLAVIMDLMNESRLFRLFWLFRIGWRLAGDAVNTSL